MVDMQQVPVEKMRTPAGLPGSGKLKIVSLVACLLDPQEGRIALDKSED